jgi:hypothetical protein
VTSKVGIAEVIVRVEPRLLNDVLCVALRQHGFTLYACPAVERRAAPRRTRHFDLAIVSGDLPQDADAATVIRIDETGTPIARDHAPVVAHGEEQGLQLLLDELRRALGARPARCQAP